MPLPLVATGHSLLPDQKFGWKPEADKETPPIPLCFGLISYNLEQFNYQKVVYVGPRFQNTYKMHEQFANKQLKLPIQKEDGENLTVNAYNFQFPKYHNSNTFSYEDAFSQFLEQLEEDTSILEQNLNYLKPKAIYEGQEDKIDEILNKKGGYWELEDELIFDSNFESGNLDFSGKVSEGEYDLLMRLDSNSRSHQCWFYFSVECIDVCKVKKGSTIKFNILNFTKPNSLYIQGMKPVAWSRQKCSSDGFGWHRTGSNIQYKLSKLCRNTRGDPQQRIYYQFSFEYTFEHDQDKVWFAYAIPYTYTMQNNFIKQIEEIQNKPENQDNNIIFKKESLGKSLSGVDIPQLTITDFSENNKRKKTILMCGRLHPGETHSSWLIHGLIRFLLSENYKAQELRKRVVFKIVPMLNPDGVIIGNYRTSLAGFDINRNFGDRQASQRLNPEAFHFKRLASQQQRLAFFFDVHSHSSKKSIFIFGPYFPLHSEHYLKLRILPKLLQERTQMFRYYSCRFRNEPHKVNSARQTFCRTYNLPFCYTIEASMMGFLNKNRQTVSLGVTSLQYFGEKLGETILDWFLIMEQHQREKIKKAIMMSKKRKTRKRTIIDILGEEDYDELREEIDDQIVFHDQEQEKQRQPKSKSASGQRKIKLKKKNIIGAESQNAQGNSQLFSEEASCLTSLQNLHQSNINFKTKERIQINEQADQNRESQRDIDSDDEQDSNTVSFALQPKIFQIKQQSITNQAKSNRGFHVPRLAGFEYLEGPDKKHPENNMDNLKNDPNFLDDSIFVYEDQANHQEGDQPLRRLEDIVGDIKRDLVRSNHNANNGLLGENNDQQFYDEGDLDSQKGFSSDDEENPKEFDPIDEDQVRMQSLLLSYFQNISKKNGFNTPVRQSKAGKHRSIGVDSSSLQRKEIVYQVKRSQVVNNPAKKQEERKRHQRNLQGVFYQHQTTQNQIDKELSYTLTHKSNQEFFELLKKYISQPEYDRLHENIQNQRNVDKSPINSNKNKATHGSRNIGSQEKQDSCNISKNKTFEMPSQTLQINRQRTIVNHTSLRASSQFVKQNNVANTQPNKLKNFVLYVEGQSKERHPSQQIHIRQSTVMDGSLNKSKNQQPSLQEVLSNTYQVNISNDGESQGTQMQQSWPVQDTQVTSSIRQSQTSLRFNSKTKNTIHSGGQNQRAFNKISLKGTSHVSKKVLLNLSGQRTIVKPNLHIKNKSLLIDDNRDYSSIGQVQEVNKYFGKHSKQKSLNVNSNTSLNKTNSGLGNSSLQNYQNRFDFQLFVNPLMVSNNRQRTGNVVNDFLSRKMEVAQSFQQQTREFTPYYIQSSTQLDFSNVSSKPNFHQSQTTAQSSQISKRRPETIFSQHTLRTVGHQPQGIQQQFSSNQSQPQYPQVSLQQHHHIQQPQPMQNKVLIDLLKHQGNQSKTGIDNIFEGNRKSAVIINLNRVKAEEEKQ